jgi:hypothetical protein
MQHTKCTANPAGACSATTTASWTEAEVKIPPGNDWRNRGSDLSQSLTPAPRLAVPPQRTCTRKTPFGWQCLHGGLAPAPNNAQTSPLQCLREDPCLLQTLSHPQDPQDQSHRPHPQPPQPPSDRPDQSRRQDQLDHPAQCPWGSDQLHPGLPSVPEIQLDLERLSHRPDRLDRLDQFLRHLHHSQRPPRQTDWDSHTQDWEGAASLSLSGRQISGHAGHRGW